MICDYAHGIAAKMGINLSAVAVVDGRRVGCLDVSLLKLSANGQVSMTLVNQSDIEDLKSGCNTGRLELKVRSALSRLTIQPGL